MQHRTLTHGLAATVLGLATLTGCQSGHEQNLQAAEGRWQDLRSHVMLETAENQFNAGQLDQCEKTVNDAARVDPTNPKLFLLAGRVALEKGELEYAFKLFAQSIVLDEASEQPSSEPYYYQGVILQRWKKHDDALERYRAAHRLEPDNASRLLAVAETLVALERFEEAKGELEDRLTYFDQNAAIRIALGHILRLQERPDEAVELYRSAALLSPDDTMLREELAAVLLEADQPDEASTELRGLLTQNDYADRTDLMRKLAASELKAGRVPEARQVYIDLTNLESGVVTDWIKLGELSWRMEDLGGSLIAAQRVMELAPNRHEGYLMAGVVWQKRGRLADALQLFDRAAQLAPTDTTALLMRGLALQKAGQPAAAAKAYEQALQRNPEDSRAQRLLSVIQSELDTQASVPTDGLIGE